jgi:hypothetical protein
MRRMPADIEARIMANGHRRAPETLTGNDLLNMEFPPITWGVPGILPAGVTLFGGREKMGKSWLAFSLCIAVATGGYMLGKHPVEQGDALYLSLEDPDRRLQKRLRRLVKDSPDLSRLHYATEWETADRGGVEDLDLWLSEHERCRVVGIDTLKRIRPLADTRRNIYETDYEAIQPFARLAAKHNVCIVILHHLNQQSEPHDPFDAFSGSSGLTAATESIWLLTRKRGDADAFLMIDGKDIEEPQELALGWDALTCTWTEKGSADEYRLIGERREIIQALKEAYPEPLGAKDVAIAVGRGDPKGYNATRQRLYQMSQSGEVKTAGRGLYTLPNNPNNPNKQDLDVRDVRDVRSEATTPKHEMKCPCDECVPM